MCATRVCSDESLTTTKRLATHTRGSNFLERTLAATEQNGLGDTDVPMSAIHNEASGSVSASTYRRSGTAATESVVICKGCGPFVFYCA